MKFQGYYGIKMAQLVDSICEKYRISKTEATNLIAIYLTRQDGIESLERYIDKFIRGSFLAELKKKYRTQGELTKNEPITIQDCINELNEELKAGEVFKLFGGELKNFAEKKENIHSKIIEYLHYVEKIDKYRNQLQKEIEFCEFQMIFDNGIDIYIANQVKKDVFSNVLKNLEI